MDDGDGMLTPAKLKAMMRQFDHLMMTDDVIGVSYLFPPDPNYALYKSPSASWGELSSALRDRLALISAERGGE